MDSVSTILANGSDFQSLESRGLTLVAAQMMREVVGGSPALNTVLASGKDFQALDDRSLSIAQAQLLRELRG